MCLKGKKMEKVLKCETITPNQGNTTNLDISFCLENEKKSISGWIRTKNILLMRQMLYIPIELPRQFSLLGRIKAIQGNANQYNLT